MNIREMKKKGIFIRLSQDDLEMIKALRDATCVNISALFRKMVKQEYEKIKTDKSKNA